MRFSRSLVAAALVGFGAASTHEGEGKTTAAAALSGAVSETTGSATTTAGSTAAASQLAAPTGAPAGMVNTHVVQVGFGGALTFEPNNVIAAVGDLVQFQFYPKNHSVVQSTFDQPCVPIQNIIANKTDAFFSGYMPVAANTSKLLTYTVRVLDTKPVWYYCSQAKHCQAGMVGAINAVTSGNKTIDAFKGLAASAPENLSPNQRPGPSQAPGAAASSGANNPNLATGTSGVAASTSITNDPAQQTGNSAPGRLSPGSQSLLGLGLGGLAALLVL